MGLHPISLDAINGKRHFQYPCFASTDPPSGPGRTSSNPNKPISKRLTPSEMTALCGAPPLEFSPVYKNIGGRKDVNVVEYPQSTVLKGKQAVKEWGGIAPGKNMDKSHNEMVGEIVGRVIARHICSDENLIITEAYGSDFGDRGCILITHYLEDFNEATLLDLYDHMDDDLRAKLTVYLNVGMLEQFDMKGLLFGKVDGVNKFGLVDLEDTKWNEVNDGIKKSNSLDQVLLFLKQSIGNKDAFNSKVSDCVREWVSNLGDDEFCTMLKHELETEAALDSQQASVCVYNLGVSASSYAKEFGL